MIARLVIAVTGALLLMSPAPQAQDAYKVVVNPSNRVSSLSPSQLSKLFLEPAAWDDGQPVVPVDLSPGSPVRELFSKHALGMPAAAVAAHWTRAVVAGSKAPLALASDADVIQFVRLKLGGIGYVSSAADVSQVKVVSVGRAASEATAARSGEQVIHGVLTTYVSALEGRDLDALKRIWPTMSVGQTRAIRAEFDHARAMRVELLDPRIDMRDDKAVVVARRRYAVTTAEGAQLQSETVTTLNLKYGTGGWVIEDIRYQTSP